MPQQAVKPKFKCDSCGERYTWKPQIAGRQAKCKCGAVLTVPETNPLEQVQAEPEPEVPQFDDYDVAAEEEAAAEEAPPLPPPPIPARGSSKSKASASSGSKSAAAAAAGVNPMVAAVNSFLPDNDNWKWWYWVIAGFLMVPCAFLEYFRLIDYETGERSTTGLRSFERVLYGIFGKWGVCGFTVAFGAICIFIGYAQFMKSRQKA